MIDRGRNTAIALVLGAFCLSVPRGSPAQEPAAQERPDTVVYELEDLVVTAHRIALPKEKVAPRVTVITGEELESRGIHFVSEALRDVPGAAVVESGSFGSLTSLFLRGGESDYVQILIDGVPVNDPGGSFDFANLTTDNVERIEILRGPGSVLYGSDAMAGVVQIFTKRGQGLPSARASVRGGTFGTLVWNGAFSGGDEVAEYSFELSRFTSDGLFEFNNEYRNTVASARVAVRPDERTEAALSLRYTDNKFHFPTNSAGQPVDENQFLVRDGFTVGLEVGRFLTPELEAHLRVAINETNVGFDDRTDGPADTLGFFAFQSQQDINRWTADLRLDYRLGPATVFTVGGELEEEKARSINKSESQFGSSSSATDASRTNGAVYAQAVVDLLDRLTLNAGARLDENEQFGTFDTYRAGAVYRLPTRTRLRASWGTGFKEPTFFENFAEGFAKGNPELDPERSRSWEVGLDQALFGERIALAFTYFDQSFRDLIQFTFSPPKEGDPNFFNVASADADGLEVEVQVRPIPQLFVDASYTHLNTEVTDSGFDEGPDATFVEGDRLLRRPANTVSVNVGYRYGRGSATVGINYVGERDDRDFSTFPAKRVTLSSYTIVDLAAEWKVLQAGRGLLGLTPTLRIENLFDKEYEEIKNFPARGRTVFIGARVGLGS